ncbi:hypothetical protein RAS1_13050 [Phycisphaerae bacterium RAS1]|nr:hypothetical protein RAS1_13050 [Phycisphaerae bacterium RAS1]
MSDRDRKLVDLPNTLRQQLAEVPETYRAWRAEIAREPTAIFHSPLFRIAVWIIVGAAVLLTARWLIGGLSIPGGGKAWEKATPWATLYVACIEPACRYAYSTQQAMDFTGWPLPCEKCAKKTVYRARLCGACRHWYATAPGAADACPHCAAAALKSAPTSQPRKKPTGDDEEDPW